MSIFKNIKSLFIIEEEEKGREKSPAPVSKADVRSNEGKEILEESREGKPGKASGKFIDILSKAMEREDLEGFDYLEFRKSLQSLQEILPDETTRFRSALASAKTLGALPEKLIRSAGHYISVLKAEEDKFEAALKMQRQKRVHSRTEELEQVNAQIAQKEAEIKKLQEEIKKLNGQKQKLATSIKESDARINSTKNDFIASYNLIVAQINSDIDKIREYGE
jgi:chromosome segregation ATPase